MFFKPRRIKELEKNINELKDKNNFLQQENSKLNDESKILSIQLLDAESFNIKLNNQTKTQKTQINMLELRIEKLNKTIKTMSSAKGGYIKQIKDKDLKIKELENKVKELSSDAYLRVKLKPQRVPKVEPIKIKSRAKTSNIARKHRIEIEK